MGEIEERGGRRGREGEEGKEGWRKGWERVGTLEVVMGVLISHILNILNSHV